jgi:hypothetical protein
VPDTNSRAFATPSWPREVHVQNKIAVPAIVLRLVVSALPFVWGIAQERKVL